MDGAANAFNFGVDAFNTTSSLMSGIAHGNLWAKEAGNTGLGALEKLMEEGGGGVAGKSVSLYLRILYLSGMNVALHSGEDLDTTEWLRTAAIDTAVDFVHDKLMGLILGGAATPVSWVLTLNELIAEAQGLWDMAESKYELASGAGMLGGFARLFGMRKTPERDTQFEAQSADPEMSESSAVIEGTP